MEKILKKLGDESIILFIVAISFAFIYINVDKDIGGTYVALGFATLAGFAYFIVSGKDPFYSKRLIKDNYDMLMVIFWTLAAYVAFVFSSNFILKTFAVTTQSTFEVLQASAPVLSNVKEIQFVTFGQLIPFIETFLFFVIIYDILLKSTNQRTPVEWYNLDSYIMIAVITVLFVMFHFTAKISTPNALWVTGVFGVISMLLIVIRKQWIEALLLHIAVNTYTMWQLLYASGLS